MTMTPEQREAAMRAMVAEQATKREASLKGQAATNEGLAVEQAAKKAAEKVTLMGEGVDPDQQLEGYGVNPENIVIEKRTDFKPL